MKTAHRGIPAYITLDGSEIRGLMRRGRAQSLAHSTVPPDVRTLLHRHLRTEELYYVTAGSGLMTPGTPHRVEANGDLRQVLLCCCSPAHAHDDTELLETAP